jgi:thiosulfate reductase cytochrome b subunit
MAAAGPGGEQVYRHRLATRITHWINFACVAVLLMSGLQILNAHPRLYWGRYGADADRPFIEFAALERPGGGLRGVTRIAGAAFDTTGLLGVSRQGGQPVERGFPPWLTIPSDQDLAAGRRWHFFFAWLLVINGLAYLLFGGFSGHFRRDLAPRSEELRPAHLVADIREHLRLRPPRGEAARRYNTLQKLTYLLVIFVLLPLMLLTGLTMSPGVDAALPGLLDLFGGRQSARTVHFITASLILLFVLVHLFEVALAGPWNEIRSMITGWYRVGPEKQR